MWQNFSGKLYYNGPRLKQLQTHTAQLYLLCYGYTRYLWLNDLLLDALKKRTNDYREKANQYAKEQALKQLATIQEARQRVSDLLIAIQQHRHAKQIPRSLIYQHIPEDELLPTAKLLVDENFDRPLLFWKYIDQVEASIVLNLHPLFLTIDLVITGDDPLQAVVSYVKTALQANQPLAPPYPDVLLTWLKPQDRDYVMPAGNLRPNRLEFLLYKTLVYHITTNKLTLKNSVRYKPIEAGLMPSDTWVKKKSKMLKQLGYDKLNAPIVETIQQKKQSLTELYHTVNRATAEGKNDQVIITKKQGKMQWRLRPLEAFKDPNESLFADFQPRSIVDVMHVVNHKTHYLRTFDSILPRATRGQRDEALIMAAILAIALRLSSEQMASICDFNASNLATTESAYVRIETLLPAIDRINDAASRLPIYREWYIRAIMHASLDGLKLETQSRHAKARYSKKYFGTGIGVAGYNKIFNFFSLASRLIGANEYEGNFAFEMVHHQNQSEIHPSLISTDKHGMNALNFALFDLTDMIFAPRIPKPHNETFWGFGQSSDYDGYLIKPTKFIDEETLPDEWDNIQRLVTSLLTGEELPSILISKLAAQNYRSSTKTAICHPNSSSK